MRRLKKVSLQRVLLDENTAFQKSTPLVHEPAGLSSELSDREGTEVWSKWAAASVTFRSPASLGIRLLWPGPYTSRTGSPEPGGQ